MRFHTYITVLTGLVMMLGSCVKDPDYLKRSDSKDNAVIYLKQGTVQRLDLKLFPFVDEARTLTLNAGFGAIGYPGGDVAIKLDVDTRAFDSINLVRTNAGLQPYEAFPAEAYSFTNRELTIAGGSLVSNLAELRYFSKKFDPAKDYLLPISIMDASGYKVNPRAKTAFLIANKLAGKPADTQGWVATASSEQTQWENTGLASALFDGNVNTYWHSSWWPSEPAFPHWIQVDMKEENYVDQIGLVRRQGSSSGFTKFNLEASADGNTWTMLLQDQAFDNTNNAQQVFPLTPAPWRHFRLTMTAGKMTSTHLAEFIVYKY